MKKVFSLILSITLIFSSLVVYANTGSQYHCSDWATKFLRKANVLNILRDEIPENFSEEISRQDVCELVVKTYLSVGKSMPSEMEEPFTDTDDFYVKKAFVLGFVNGVSETTFAPDMPLTREQMATIIDRLLLELSVVGSVNEEVHIQDVDDFYQISDWALPGMEYMYGAGIIQGDNNNLFPKENLTEEEAITMLVRACHFIGHYVKLYEDTTVDILAELDIVDKEKITSNDSLSVFDFFVMIEKMRGKYSDNATDISDWYVGDTLASLDDLEDNTKMLLLSLCYNGRNQILDYNAIPNLQLDKKITNAEALFYILRMVGDTYSCTDSTFNGYENDISIEKIYDGAYQKGLISSDSTENADYPITYQQLCKILHKALFTEFSSGGYAGDYIVRLYDELVKESTSEEENESEIKIQQVEIPIAVKIHDDLSVSWTLPEEYQFILESKYNTRIGNTVYGSFKTELSSTDMIEFLSSEEFFGKSAIRCTYTKYGADTEYYSDIDISNIKFVVEGEALIPDKYIRANSNTWIAKELTLSDSQFFEEGCYYLMTGYEKTYRKEEYNCVDYKCFEAETTSSVYVAPNNYNFGVSYLDEIHIQRIKVTGNSKDGFVLYVTPEANKVFEIWPSE
ncbi:MAG: S-layer homology domain-containing protein [Ruminococcaceae bacterium]|nr:S-layer homology domain-containing protein [Oscillospiraceae bacterium]